MRLGQCVVQCLVMSLEVGLQDVITKELKIRSKAAPESFRDEITTVFGGKTLFAEMDSFFLGVAFLCIKWIHFILIFQFMAQCSSYQLDFMVNWKNENIIEKLFHRAIEGYTL